MAELVIPVGHYMATVTFGGTSQPRGAVVSWGGLDELVSIDPEAVGDVIEPLLTPLHEAVATENCSITGLLVKKGPNTTGPFHQRSLSIPGDQALDAPPTQVALGVRKGTALGGHEHRGRMFWPSPPETNVQVDGTWDSGALTQFNDAFDTFLAGLASGDVPMELLHSSAGTAPDLVTSLTVAPQTYTQRRRNRRS